jgi:hypothetical protein
MTYRDPLEAARRRAEAARERVEELQERLSPKLELQLEDDLRQRLARAREQVAPAAEETLEGWREREHALERLAAVLEEIAALAPQIERRFNRVPGELPERAKPRPSYLFADVYQPAIESLRSWCHGKLRAIDPGVTLHDTRPRYFDTQEEPYLVDASFTAGGAPLRLHVAGRFLMAGNSSNLNLPPSALRTQISLLARVPRSVPPATLTSQGLVDRALLALRIKREAVIDDAEIDERFVIAASADDARALLQPELRQALLRLAQAVELERLEIGDGLARLDFDDRGAAVSGLDEAIAVMVALRATEPTRLVR